VSEKIRVLEERREELARDWATGEVTKKEWSTARRAISDELERLTRALSRDAHSMALAQFAAMEGDCWDRWEHLTNGAAAPWSRPLPTRSPSTPPPSRARPGSTPTA
jgi:hypothetical protein